MELRAIEPALAGSDLQSLKLPPRSDRERYRGEIWEQVLRGLDPADTVMELCPGESTKIGSALAALGFSGTIYLLEPCKELATRVAASYRELLPGAEVVLLPLTVRELLELPSPLVDAVVANHPLDDMIVGEVIPPSAWDDTWAGTYRTPGRTLARIQEWWRGLAAEPALLEKAMRAAAGNLAALLSKLNPPSYAIYQYPSTTLSEAGFSLPDECAARALEMARTMLGRERSGDEQLRRIDQPPEQWLIGTRSPELQATLRAPPEALARLGSEIFLRLPAYGGKGTVLLSDPALLARHTRSATLGRDEEAALSAALASDLDARPGDLPAGTVYVDRQADPSGIALGLNKGSGRAAYLGSRFNIKGIGRTPLVVDEATSVHGTGRLNLMKGAWEMLVANTIARNFWTAGSAIPALGIDGRTFELKGRRWAAVKALRVDGGDLDRPAHALVPGAAADLDLARLARGLGRLDAEQLIERIVHNAWSVANFSRGGSLIDFDTASAVSGRCPHFSYNCKYPAVLFGMEGEGKRLALATLHEHLPATPRHSAAEILDQYEEARRAFLPRRFLRLLGLDGEESLMVWRSASTLVEGIAELFAAESPKMVPNFEALDLMKRLPSPAVFDFSTLLRNFQLLRLAELPSLEETAVRLLLARPCADERPHPKFAAPLRRELFARGVVVEDGTSSGCRAAAARFVATLGELCERIDSLPLSSSRAQRAARAYRANEERRYLMIGSMSPFLAELDGQVVSGALSARQLQPLLHALLDASDRRIIPDGAGELSTDSEIFREGHLRTVIHRDGSVARRFTPFEATSPLGRAGALLVGSEELVRLGKSFEGPVHSCATLLEARPRICSVQPTGSARDYVLHPIIGAV